MTTYCVWFDQFFEEIFALEKIEFDKYDNLLISLNKEKNVIHYIESDSMKDACQQYKENYQTNGTSPLSYSVH